MKLLMISGMYPTSQKSRLRKLSRSLTLQEAPNEFQWAIANGLADNEVDFSAISLPFLGTYPLNFRALHTGKCSLEINGKQIGESLNYCTLPWFKNLSIRRGIKKAVSQWINENPDEELWVLTYTSLTDFIEPIVRLKRHHKNLKLATIITDLPTNMLDFKENRSALKRIQCSIEKRNQYRLYPFIDRFILLTEAMTEKIPQAEGKFMVMEGIKSLNEHEDVSQTDRQQKTLLYTGTLSGFAGVSDLVKAFMTTTDPELRLIICGSGEEAAFVADCAAKDNRIDFRGSVDHEEAIRLQRSATALINPRKPNGNITKYSFPSKTMEYLASGTPMIGYRLEGIPAEYFDHIYCIDDLTTKALAEKIDEVLHLDQSQLRAKAEKAYEFIATQKNSKAQVKRILDFLSA